MVRNKIKNIKTQDYVNPRAIGIRIEHSICNSTWFNTFKVFHKATSVGYPRILNGYSGN